MDRPEIAGLILKIGGRKRYKTALKFPGRVANHLTERTVGPASWYPRPSRGYVLLSLLAFASPLYGGQHLENDRQTRRSPRPARHKAIGVHKLRMKKAAWQRLSGR